MKKKSVIRLALITMFFLGTVPATAKVTTCTVAAISGKEVVLQCEKPGNLAVGDEVRVKPKKKKAIEGC